MHARWLWLVPLAVAGCAQQSYVYQPTSMATATIEGVPASQYPVPPEAPRGDVTIGSLGVTRMDKDGSSAAEFVHTRMVVSNNNGDGPWTIDPGRQLLSLPGHTPIGPAYVNSSAQVTPQATVAPGQKVTLDLFYPLPADMPQAKQVPEFDVLWSVNTQGRLVAERTSFERLEVAPADLSPGAYAWADGWWADPFWYGPFGPHPYWRDPLGPRFIVVRRPPHVVVRSPRYVARPTQGGWRRGAH
jgi:hypothetical protein